MKKYRVEVLDNDGMVAMVVFVKAEKPSDAKSAVRARLVLRAEETDRWPSKEGK